jgi:hypothetical protein
MLLLLQHPSVHQSSSVSNTGTVALPPPSRYCRCNAMDGYDCTQISTPHEYAHFTQVRTVVQYYLVRQSGGGFCFRERYHTVRRTVDYVRSVSHTSSRISGTCRCRRDSRAFVSLTSYFCLCRFLSIVSIGRQQFATRHTSECRFRHDRFSFLKISKHSFETARSLKTDQNKNEGSGLSVVQLVRVEVCFLVFFYSSSWWGRRVQAVEVEEES